MGSIHAGRFPGNGTDRGPGDGIISWRMASTIFNVRWFSFWIKFHPACADLGYSTCRLHHFLLS